MSGKMEFELSSLPLVSVTVFSDRAEVSRTAKCVLQAGKNCVFFTNITESADKDAFRVDGEGDASVVDVAFREKWISVNEAKGSAKVQNLKSELKKLEEEKALLIKEKERNAEKIKFWQQYAKGVTTGSFVGEKADGRESIKPDTLDQLEKFVQRLDEQQEIFDSKEIASDEKLKNLLSKIESTKDNLSDLEDHGMRAKQNRELEITLESTKGGEATLRITYIVYNARWSSLYDIRATGGSEPVQIHYKALVTQGSGEEWTDAKIFLSTAQPSLSGVVPKIGTLNLRFYEPPPPPQDNRMFYSARALSKRAAPRAMAAFQTDSSTEQAFDEPETFIEHIEAGVSETSYNTTFEIQHKTTIPCDNQPYTVTIGVVELKADYLFTIIPKKTENAFLTAKMTNTSKLVFLSGKSNVFINNNFVAKAHLERVAPNEEFSCSLGVDPAIRVKYHPVKKFSEQSGYLTKSTSVRYEQKIELYNTRKDEVEITMEDNLPRSSTEKIKVRLTEPVLENDPDTKLNNNNNVEWNLKMKPNEKKEIFLKYTVEHPPAKKLEEYETQ